MKSQVDTALNYTLCQLTAMSYLSPLLW